MAFLGTRHHKHKYALGHKAQSLRTFSGVPLVTLISPDNESDQDFIIVLIEELIACYPCLRVAYIILDRGNNVKEIHHDPYEFFDTIPFLSGRRWSIQEASPGRVIPYVLLNPQ